MATYTIVSESNGNVEHTCFTSTRKREIVTLFNRFMKNLIKSGRFSICMIREGYARYTYNGQYGTINGEYYIVRN